MSAEFDEAAARVKNLQSLPSNEELLDLYGYFKQVRSGIKRTITVMGVRRLSLRVPSYRKVLQSIV